MTDPEAAGRGGQRKKQESVVAGEICTPASSPHRSGEGMLLWEILIVTIVHCLLQIMCHSHMYEYVGPPHPHTPSVCML